MYNYMYIISSNQVTSQSTDISNICNFMLQKYTPLKTKRVTAFEFQQYINAHGSNR